MREGTYVHCPRCSYAFDLAHGACGRCAPTTTASAFTVAPPAVSTHASAAVYTATAMIVTVPALTSTIIAAPRPPCPRARVTAATGELLAAIADASAADLDALLAEGVLVPDAHDDPWAAVLLSAIVAAIARRQERTDHVYAEVGHADPAPLRSHASQQAFWLGFLVGVLTRVERGLGRVIDRGRAELLGY